MQDLLYGQELGERPSASLLPRVGRDRDGAVFRLFFRRGGLDLRLVEERELVERGLLALRSEALRVDQPLPLLEISDQLGLRLDRRLLRFELVVSGCEKSLLLANHLAKGFNRRRQLGARHARTIPKASCYATDSDEKFV